MDQISAPNSDTSNLPSENSSPKVNKFKSKKALFSLIVVLIILAGLAGGFFYFYPKYKHPTSSDLSPKPTTATANLSSAAFAPYKEIKSTVKPDLASYTLKSSELTNLNAVSSAEQTKFSQNQLNALETDGFFLLPTKAPSGDPTTILDIRGGRSDDMVDLYKLIGGNTADYDRKPENAVFVTTDFLLHTYHVLTDRTFQKAEEVYFQPDLSQLSDVLYTDALNHYNQEQNPDLKASWKRLAVFYLVPKIILSSTQGASNQYFTSEDEQNKYLQEDKNADTPARVQKWLQSEQSTTPTEIYKLASQEIDLIMQAKAFGVVSPLFGDLKPDDKVDYTQFEPRGHYTRNSVLRSYFRAMMWYGREGFNVNNSSLTRDAVLMTWQLGSVKVAGKLASDVWQQIYLPTVFFVGKSDDLSFYDYTDLLSKVYGSSVPYSELSDPTKLQSFQNLAQKLPGPKILSSVIQIDPSNPPTKDALLQSTKGFRFMGQRFTPDSYMFSSLTQGDEKPDPATGQKLPSMPTALMVMSILGSNTADSLLTDWISTNAPHSDKVITKVKNQLKSEVAKYDQATWTQNIYWGWLYNLLPLFDSFNNGYPMFMRSADWAKKDLQTALGSWTELRHDTLLYSKQSFAEMGGGGTPPTPPPVPKGYVEPNLSFLTRLIALNKMTEDGLNSRNLLVPGQKEKFDSFADSLQFFKTIAEKELSNSTISDDDFEKLRTIISLDYPNIVWTPDGDEMTEQDARTGIIADVHTDACGRDSQTGGCTYSSQVLYEATGVPSEIYVAVKDKNGTRLARGVTFSYYEFSEPTGTRMTDEDWQSMIYDGKNTNQIPAHPAWTTGLIKH